MHHPLLHVLFSSNRHAYSPLPRSCILVVSPTHRGRHHYKSSDTNNSCLRCKVSWGIPFSSLYFLFTFWPSLIIKDYVVGYRISVTHACCTCTIYAMTLTVDSLASHRAALSTRKWCCKLPSCNWLSSSSSGVCMLATNEP